MQIQTELDPLVECYLRLPGAVHVAGVLALHDPLPVVQLRLAASLMALATMNSASSGLSRCSFSAMSVKVIFL